jgi:hypothetical protein
MINSHLASFVYVMKHYLYCILQKVVSCRQQYNLYYPGFDYPWILLTVPLKKTVKLCRNIVRMFITRGKGKAIPLQALTVPEDSRRLRLPYFNTIGTWRWQGCQPYAPAVFTPRKYSWYSFLLEAESTPGPYCDRKDYVNKKIQWHHRESIPWPSG